MDDNNCNQIEDKLIFNFAFSHPELDFNRNQEFFPKDGFTYMQHPTFYGSYDYHPPQQSFCNPQQQVDKDYVSSHQEMPYATMEMVPYPVTEREAFKVYKPDFFVNYLSQGLIRPSPDSYSLIGVPPEYYSCSQYTIPASENKIKIQEPDFSVENGKRSNSKIRSRSRFLVEPKAEFLRNPYQHKSQQQIELQNYNKAIVVGGITRSQRNNKIRLYLQKKKRRTYTKKIAYVCRKKVADQRMRIRGRFVTNKQAMESLEVGEGQGPQTKKNELLSQDSEMISNVKIQQADIQLLRDD